MLNERKTKYKYTEDISTLFIAIPKHTILDRRVAYTILAVTYINLILFMDLPFPLIYIFQCAVLLLSSGMFLLLGEGFSLI